MNKKRIADLIRADIIMMNGGKNRLKSTMIIFFIFSIAVGFFINSAAGMIYAPIIMGVLFVPMIFANEQKYHSEKMYAMIPVDRKEVVRSRFIMTIGLYTIVCLIIYTLMLIAMKAALYKKILGGFDAAELYLDKINSAFGAHMSLFGLNNLLFWVSFSMGLSISAGTLRKYFKNGKSISTKIEGRSLREYQKRDYVIFFAVLGVLALFFLCFTGILPITTALIPVIALLLQLMKIMNGILFCAVVLILAVFSAVYSFICTLMEYEDKEI